jgi:transposase-like protein
MARGKRDAVSEATLGVASTESVESRDELDERLAAQLVEHARGQGTSLVGPDGLLGKLTKLVFETGLGAEMSEHLGYQPYGAAGRNSGNSRNGSRSKTVTTEIGPLELDVPRDRDGSFEPQLVRKRQRRLSGVDDMVCSLVAGGSRPARSRRTWPRSTARGSPATRSAASPTGCWRACRGGGTVHLTRSIR